MHDETLWGRTEAATSYPELERDSSAAVLVIGAGITGLATALCLQERGHDVTVIEMNRVGLGTTGHSSGHLDITSDTGKHELMEAFGVEAGRQAVQAAGRALERAREWTRKYGIDCDMVRVPGYLYAEDDEHRRVVDQQGEAYRVAGAKIDKRASVPLPIATAGALRFFDQIRFDPLDFSRGLARAIVRNGGRIHEGTRVQRVHDHRKGTTVETTRATIEAQHVVVATHAPLFGFVSLQSRAHPFQSYLIAVRVRDEIEDALYWDTMSPYHYTRVIHSEEPDVLLIGGADHRTGDVRDTHRRFDDLRAYAQARFDVHSVRGQWSHEYFEPSDRLPYIGRLPGRHNTYIATGFSGDGLSWGLVTAEVVADAIEEREHPLHPIITPSRIKPLASASEMASAGLVVAKHAIGDHIAFADVERLEEIPAREGRLIRVGSKRLAVYRDETGGLHAMSPICRHAGCIVQWNSAASTWDCPCHGGRYDAYGRVISAPPKDDLEKMDF